MTGCRILVVDDNEFILEATATALGLAGYDVETAANGLEALHRVEEAAPSAIVLDLMMPVMDGFSLARILRERGVRLPLVVISASTNGKAWADQIGATFVAKPFGAGELLAALQQAGIGPDRPMNRAA